MTSSSVTPPAITPLLSLPASLKTENSVLTLQVPTLQASSTHIYPGGWRRCHVAQKLCRDGKVIIPGVSVLLCLFAIPVSSSMHFLFIFPSHCSHFFSYWMGILHRLWVLQKSSCLQLLSFLPSLAGGMIVLSGRSLKSIFSIFLDD